MVNVRIFDTTLRDGEQSPTVYLTLDEKIHLAKMMDEIDSQGKIYIASGRFLCSEAARQLDYLVVAGPDYAAIMSRYADITGHAPVLPEWASGFWQCKLRYGTQEELLEVAREYQRRELPL